MKRLYHHLVTHRWGEPTDLTVFDGSLARQPSALDQVHIAIWAPPDDGVTTFFTLGMSEIPMPGQQYRVELTLGIRGPVSSQLRAELAGFLANITEYPFSNALALNWWERLANPGTIPGFPDCTQLLFAPMSVDPKFETFGHPDEDVKVLAVIPITPSENHILKDHGVDAMLEHWETTGTDVFTPRKDHHAA
jgi:hypothetical protein